MHKIYLLVFVSLKKKYFKIFQNKVTVMLCEEFKHNEFMLNQYLFTAAQLIWNQKDHDIDMTAPWCSG